MFGSEFLDSRFVAESFEHRTTNSEPGTEREHEPGTENMEG